MSRRHRHSRAPLGALTAGLLIVASGMAISAAPATGAPDADRVAAGEIADADIPITEVTLFRSGIASFTRETTVRGDATLRLDVGTSDVNDLLKSLVVMDLDGGRVESVGYSAEEPVKKRLESLGLSDPSQLTMDNLLLAFRGIEVRLTTAEGQSDGRVLGVDRRAAPAENGTITEAWVSLLTSGGVRSVLVGSIRSLELLDPGVQEEMDELVAVIGSQRTEKSRPVEIRLRGDGERTILAAYVAESPVWKTSYRLLLPEPGESRGRMQGWAIVENTTDEDWEDVQLSLVSGRPISFTMGLSSPFYVARPHVPVPLEAAAQPRAFAGGTVARVNEELTGGAMMEDRAAGRGGHSPFQNANTRRNRESIGLARVGFESTTIASATPTEAGEVFSFRLNDRVTVPRQRSAMLPIIAGDLETRRVSVSSPGAGEHPTRAVEVVNGTGSPLLPGPIGVYDNGVYAGDAQVGHVPAGDKRLLGYSTDLDVSVRRTEKSSNDVQRVSIVNGVFRQTIAQETVTTFEISNKDASDGRTLVIEQYHWDGWDFEPDVPVVERSGNIARMEIEVDAGGAERFETVARRVQRETVGFDSMSQSRLVKLSRDGAASDEVIEAFREWGSRRGAIRDLERRIGEIDNASGAISADQQRVRENMRTVGQNTDLYARYLAKLTEQEDRLEELARERSGLVGERDAAEASLRQWLSNLNVG